MDQLDPCFAVPFDPTGQVAGRRTVIGSLAGAAVSLLLPVRPALAWQRERLFAPETFGARGDGVTDDYPALSRLAAAVSQAGGGTIRFGRRKRYLIDRYQVAGGPARNDVTHIYFDGCAGLRVDLNESTIEVKGDFHRAGDLRNGRLSWSSAIAPFFFRNCTDLIVENGSLDGNAGRMTRDPRVAESAGHGIALHGCTRVRLRGLHVHHFSSDGVIIRPGQGRPSREVDLHQVRLTNNGRQGLTNAGGQQVTATDCDFSETGQTGGPYRHAPSAGVDVEPHPGPATRSDFRAVNCRFDNNRGAPVVAGSPDLASTVELVNCSGRCDSQRRMILSAERAVIRGGSWHNVQIACAYAAHRPFERTMSVDVSGATWTGDDPAWAPVYDLNPKRPTVRIHGNRFELRSAQPFTPAYLFQCANPNHRFEDNQIFVASGGHAGTGDDWIAQFAGAQVRRNRWSTDLRPPGRFMNDYRGAAAVEGESFAGAFGRRDGPA